MIKHAIIIDFYYGQDYQFKNVFYDFYSGIMKSISSQINKNFDLFVICNEMHVEHVQHINKYVNIIIDKDLNNIEFLEGYDIYTFIDSDVLIDEKFNDDIINTYDGKDKKCVIKPKIFVKRELKIYDDNDVYNIQSMFCKDKKIDKHKTFKREEQLNINCFLVVD